MKTTNEVVEQAVNATAQTDNAVAPLAAVVPQNITNDQIDELLVKFGLMENLQPTLENLYAFARAVASSVQAQPQWISVEERLPEVGTPVVVYTPPMESDWPGSIRLEIDCIDPNDDDHASWAGHNDYYEHYCCVAKPEGSTGPSEKAPYTYWMSLPSAPGASPLPAPVVQQPSQLTMTPELRSLAEKAQGKPIFSEDGTNYHSSAKPATMLALLDRLEELQARLEISPDHPYDGIACRDETIRQQDARIAELDIKCTLYEASLEKADRRIAELEAEVAHWKANHADIVKRKALLEQRPDLPVDRIPAYREMERLQAFERSTLAASQVEAEPVAWTYGPNEFKDWCANYFGPDSDDTYLAEAVFNLPPMAQKFARSDVPSAQPPAPALPEGFHGCHVADVPAGITIAAPAGDKAEPLTFEQIEDSFPEGGEMQPDGRKLVSAAWLHEFAHNLMPAGEKAVLSRCDAGTLDALKHFELVQHGANSAWLILRANPELGLGSHTIRFDGEEARNLVKRFGIINAAIAAAQVKGSGRG